MFRLKCKPSSGVIVYNNTKRKLLSYLVTNKGFLYLFIVTTQQDAFTHNKDNLILIINIYCVVPLRFMPAPKERTFLCWEYPTLDMTWVTKRTVPLKVLRCTRGHFT
jgi:hypothetical protein